MKILLDENLPQQWRYEVIGHDCSTAAYCGLAAVENGALLRAAASAGFDAMLSMDRGLEFQHDLDRLPLSVVVLRAPSNRIESIRPLIPALLAALDALRPRTLVVVL